MVYFLYLQALIHYLGHEKVMELSPPRKRPQVSQYESDDIRQTNKKLKTEAIPEINRFHDQDNGNLPPGTSMYHDTPIEVSEKMQYVILENSTIFDQPPMGPLHTLIPEQCDILSTI